MKDQKTEPNEGGAAQFVAYAAAVDLGLACIWLFGHLVGFW